MTRFAASLVVVAAVSTAAAPGASAFVVAPSAAAIAAASRHVTGEDGSSGLLQQHARERSAMALHMVAQPPVKPQKVSVLMYYPQCSVSAPPGWPFFGEYLQLL